MRALNQSLRRIPYWAYLLVLIVIFVDTAYLIYRGRMPRGGETIKFENGFYIHDYVKPGSPVDKAGIRPGDTLVSMNSIPIEKWDYYPKVGDTVVAGILRNNQEVRLTVIVGSVLSNSLGFYGSAFIVMILLSISSLYILLNKPHDKTAMLFFIYLQLMAIIINSGNLCIPDPLALLANIAFHLSSCLLGPILIHFHLLFPRPVKFYARVKWLPLLLYASGFVISIAYSASYIVYLKTGYNQESIFFNIEKISLWWLTISFFLALLVAFIQYLTLKDTLSRNQVRMVIIGSFFGFITPMFFALFYDRIIRLTFNNPNPLEISQGICSLIMICCFLIAIFRYRIWDTEIFIRKALLYLGATLMITLTYLLLVYFINQFAYSLTNFSRFLILALSVLIFLVMRDLLQRGIDRLFHRESYDSASVVSDFEEKLAGIYKIDELKSRIVQGLDEIFYFKSFVLNLNKDGLIYEPVVSFGMDLQKIDGEFKISRELENKLYKSKVFSPGELEQKSSVLEVAAGELIVPIMKDGQPYGFFLCGPKKSEKSYSMQDIRVLSLIAKRVIALFQTAALYQKDLDRQLMLERERTRISQDMHDDVGASLTRISMMSDLIKNRTDVGGGARQWLGKISDTSRGLMEEMNQIIWALNPKNDNLEGLVAYVRRFAFEYLEPSAVNCVFDLPGELPNRALSVEVRRNVYLVVREALHNVVKHAGATTVWVNLEMNEQGFRIRIKDDGSGFNPSKLEFPGNGLTNMKKRMNDIGGELVIRSKAGEGTEIKLVVVLRTI